jgi:hypothetical protein
MISEDILKFLDDGKLQVLKLPLGSTRYMSRELLLRFIQNVREGARFKFKGYISKRKQEGKDHEFETSFVDEII